VNAFTSAPNPEQFDYEQVYRTIGIYHGRRNLKGCFEIRALNVDRSGTVPGYFRGGDAAAANAAAAAIENLSGRASGIYFTPNIVKIDCLARSSGVMTPWAKITTTDNEIVRRLWLLIHFDAVRIKGISANDAEHKNAIERAYNVRDYLAPFFGPASPVISDSSNGAHLDYAINLSNNAASTELIRNILIALARRFDDKGVKIDTVNFNAARIWKLPGTLTRKGSDDPKRPYRLARLLEVPETTELVPVKMMQEVIKAIPASNKKQSQQDRSSPKGWPREPFDLMIADLKASAIQGKSVKQMGCEPQTGDEIYSQTETSKKKGIRNTGGGYKIPYWTVDGEIILDFWRLKIFNTDGYLGVPRYAQTPGSSPRVYFPPGPDWRKYLCRPTDADADYDDQPKQPIILVEGEKKSYCACIMGFLTLGLGGVYNFQSKKLGRIIIRDLSMIDWVNRIVYLAYDSDRLTKDDVLDAEKRLAEELSRRGAIVKIVQLTSTPASPSTSTAAAPVLRRKLSFKTKAQPQSQAQPKPGSKRGLDDFLIQEGSEAFKQLLADAIPYVPQFAELNRDCALCIDTGNILMVESGIVYPYSVFKNTVGAVYSRIEMNQRGKQEVISFVPFWLANKNRNSITSMDYEPTQPFPYYVTGEGAAAKRYFNRWRGMGLVPERAIAHHGSSCSTRSCLQA